MIYFCADDYGISRSSNTRIEECLKKGVLNKISVLPNGDLSDFNERLLSENIKLSLLKYLSSDDSKVIVINTFKEEQLKLEGIKTLQYDPSKVKVIKPAGMRPGRGRCQSPDP